METSVFCSDLSVTKGLTLGRLTAKALIRDSLEGHLEGDPIQDELKRRERKPKVIEMSKKYCIVTQVALSIHIIYGIFSSDLCIKLYSLFLVYKLRGCGEERERRSIQQGDRAQYRGAGYR